MRDSGPCYHPRVPPGSRPSLLRAALFAFVGVHAVFLLMWAVVVATSGPQQNDWALLKAVAERFVAGDTGNLYARGEGLLIPGYFWIYPPFVLFPLAVLAPLPPLAAYLLLAGLAVAATARSLVLLDRVLRFGDAKELVFLSVFCSAPFLTTVVTGQLSGLLLLGIAGAGSLWTGGNVVGAGALLGLFVAKPNWGLVFGLMMVVRREWRAAAVMAAVALACGASGLLPGVQLWKDFFAAAKVSMEMQGHYDPYTIITLRGFLEAVLPSTRLAYLVWAGEAALMLASAVSIWRRSLPPLEHLGAAVLLVIAANPYAHFYDALLLALPAVVWWTGRDEWLPAPWRAVGAMLAATWTWEQAAWSWPMLLGGAESQPELPFSIVGPVAGLWLVLRAVVAARRPV